MKIKDKRKLLNIFLSLCGIFFFLFIATGSESKPRQAKEMAVFLCIASFIVSVIGAIAAYFTSDEDKRTIAGIGSVIFLIVSIIALLNI